MTPGGRLRVKLTQNASIFKAINIIDSILVLNFRKQLKTQSQDSGVTQTYQILANETPSPVFNRQ